MATEVEPGEPLEISDSLSSTEHLSIEDRMGNRLEQALKTENDFIILQAWVPACEQYESLQKYIPRIQFAKKRLDALEFFRSALNSGDYEKIVKSFDPVLNDYSPTIRPEEWQRLSEAVAFVFRSCSFGQGTDERWLQATLLRRFVDACRANDDEGIISAFHAIQDAGYVFLLQLTSQELDRVERAERRIGVRQKFQEALSNGYLRQIADAYVLVLKNDVTLVAEEQDQAELATRFVYTFNLHEKDDESLVTAEEDRELVSIYEEIDGSSHRQNLRLTVHEQERVQKAKQRIKDLEQVRTALKNGKPQDIFDTCASALLFNIRHLDTNEQEQLRLAKLYIETLRAQDNSTDHPAVVEVYNRIVASPCSNLFFFTPQEIPGVFSPQPGNIAQRGPTLQDEMMLIIIIAGQPVYNRQFQRTYRIKQQYLWLRLSQLQAKPNMLPTDIKQWIFSQKGVLEDIQSLGESEQKKISQQLCEDIADGYSMEKEINSLVRVDKDKAKERLDTIFDEFKQRDGFAYPAFLLTNHLTDKEVKETLALYARREFLAENLVKRHQHHIYSWLKNQRQNIAIEYPAQQALEEKEDGKGWNPLRLIDWFRT